jgi:hypothetical protein
MNWNSAIERYRLPLLNIVATLYAMIGLTEGGSIGRLGRPVYRKVLSLLRPAEAAVRRLIFVAAQGLVAEPRTTRVDPTGRGAARKRKGKGKASRRRSFQLIDPLLRAGRFYGRRKPAGPRSEPRIRSFDTPAGVVVYVNGFPPAPPPHPKPKSDGSVSGKSLCRRLEALRDALQDLPRQALRYARWRDKPMAERRPLRETALRRGPPPGLREKSRHEVHEILKECHWLARSLPALDSS